MIDETLHDAVSNLVRNGALYGGYVIYSIEWFIYEYGRRGFGEYQLAETGIANYLNN